MKSPAVSSTQHSSQLGGFCRACLGAISLSCTTARLEDLWAEMCPLFLHPTFPCLWLCRCQELLEATRCGGSPVEDFSPVITCRYPSGTPRVSSLPPSLASTPRSSCPFSFSSLACSYIHSSNLAVLLACTPSPKPLSSMCGAGPEPSRTMLALRF